ncbi:MAG: ABC transporter permease [Candidatus Omnitrophica bacterium]|nr:ABC transporter permease [Candidatus Omnitrophota bacterium]
MIELKNISKTYLMGQTQVHAIRDVSLEIKQGDFTAIMGASGSGKSTLLHILGFLDRPDSGTYSLAGRKINNLKDSQLAVLRNNLAGFVFQQFFLLSQINALENVEMPLIYAGKRHLRQKAREKINEVGLSSRESHRPNELSGGEQQRVAIARSLVNDPLVILADEPTGNLDTVSGKEIMTILEDLNKKGKTIIMVTHEAEIARYARRIIRMRDGQIISDQRTESDLGQRSTSETKTEIRVEEKGEREKDSQITEQRNMIPLETILSQSHQSVGKTEFMDHLRQAWHAIIAHKMRSALSMLGILIGVAAVIAMLALGQGAKESMEQRLASLGSNLLIVRPGASRRHGVSLASGTVTRFTLDDARAIAELNMVKAVSPALGARAQLVYGNKNWNTRVQGTGVDFAPMRAFVPDFGRFFNQKEFDQRQKVAVIGLTVAGELFKEENPIGRTIKINKINFQVIGILPEKGANAWRDFDDIVIIPVTTAMYRVLGRKYIGSVNVQVAAPDLMEEAQEAIKRIIIQRHHLSKKEENSFNIRNLSEIQETLESTTKTMGWLLGSIAAISLLVGGIGIMNIMLVSVTERTREIGLRKAIGAQAKDIMIQFLIEAVVMTIVGGCLGIILGAGIAFLMSALAGWGTTVSMFSVILATGFSVSVGLFFGLWPARQAARLNPIEALRYE